MGLPLEIEATFINVDKDALREKLRSVGAQLVQPEILMRRVVFDTGPNSFARVRDEGDKIVMTYKKHHSLDLTGTEEVNLIVDDYDHAVSFLKSIGLEDKAHQETLRETWDLDGTEITIDTWPWIPTYVEVEGPSASAVQDVAARLGYDMSDAHYGSVDEIYKIYYDVTNDDINYLPEIKFVAVPDWLEQKKRNIESLV